MFAKISRPGGNGGGAGGKAGTWREVKKHPNAKQATLSATTRKTLGSGDLVSAVRLPEGEDRSEWLAANTVDFFNELSLLYGLVAEEAAERFTQAGEGFPQGFEYRWQVSPKDLPVRCSAADYCEFVLVWVEDHISNEAIFPVHESEPFPADFETYLRDMYKRMFRIFCIMYHSLFASFERLGAVAHLNTCLKHYVYFCLEFDLLPETEMKALKGPTDRIKASFMADRSEAASGAPESAPPPRSADGS